MKRWNKRTQDPTAAFDAVFAEIAAAARPQVGEVDLVDGGSMEERMRAEGWWDLLPADLKANMKRNGRVVLHVDRKTRVALGFHFEKLRRTA
ncbi:hypothetical protein [Rhizobium leguminosarum]|uniref:hypothetical protein n=1 Tax=Rhizobium leguminosarum TaxID=384 RepID=UPI001F4602D9|nr:hypothetical protein [Rhizobium leguminosarum]UIK19361.1 hypothetical protein LZK79_10235 [Rhizobium leguminosarum]